MRKPLAGLVALVGSLVGFQVACEDAPRGADVPPPSLELASMGCSAFEQRPGIAKAVRAYPALTFDVPVELVPDPPTGTAYVVELLGTIQRFVDTNDAATTEKVLDLSDVVLRAGDEDGLLGVAVERRNGDVALIVKYTARRVDGANGVRVVVARVKSDDGGRSFRRDSLEEIIGIDQAMSLHHGGPPKLGRDGMLYIPVGDGTWEGDRPSQDLARLSGSILRIDVSRAPYAVPPDNPFVGKAGARPEIFAYGFRNPHGWSFDPDDASLWVGDVGFGTFEELDHVVAGANYGWPIREGAHCMTEPCDGTGLVDPVYEYPTVGGAAIIGGPVYRGSRLPRLAGRVMVADYSSGRVEAVSRTGPPDPILVDDTGLVVTSLSADKNGEPILADVFGRLWSFEPREAGTTVPALLSQTGCVDVRAPRSAPSGLLPYDVNMPLWSDGTEKARWLSLPAGAKLRVLDDLSLEAPIGSVAVKTFFWADRPIETRLFVRHEDGDWGGYSFAWRPDGSDADLLEHTRVEDVGGLVWTYPSRSQCLSCHTESAGRTLGLDLAQMNGPSDQLDQLDALGLFEPPLRELGTLPRFPRRDDADADPAAWSRAYLHANCSHCHRPNAPGRGSADFLASAPLALAGCNQVPDVSDLGIGGARVIVPGSPSTSVLFARMSSRGAAQMPPLGTTLPDHLAEERFRTWIGSMTTCEPGP